MGLLFRRASIRCTTLMLMLLLLLLNSEGASSVGCCISGAIRERIKEAYTPKFECNPIPVSSERMGCYKLSSQLTRW